jgi:hypothetical protein
MSDLPPVEERFKSNFQEFVAVLVDVINTLQSHKVATPLDAGGLQVASLWLSTQSGHSLIDRFITKTSGFWDQIKDHNVKFLIHHFGDIFDDLPMVHAHLPKISKLLEMTFLHQYPQDNRQLVTEIDELLDVFWKLLEACVRQSIFYVDEGRHPTVVTLPDGTAKRQYSTSFYPSLKVGKLITEWEVKV